MHRVAAIACLTAGVYLILGAGWALLLLGSLIWLAGPGLVSLSEIRAWVVERWDQVRRVVASMPRRVASLASMVTGLVAIPTGTFAVAGVGVAVVTAGVLLLGFSLLTGWNL